MSCCSDQKPVRVSRVGVILDVSYKMGVLALLFHLAMREPPAQVDVKVTNLPAIQGVYLYSIPEVKEDTDFSHPPVPQLGDKMQAASNP